MAVGSSAVRRPGTGVVASASWGMASRRSRGGSGDGVRSVGSGSRVTGCGRSGMGVRGVASLDWGTGRLVVRWSAVIPLQENQTVQSSSRARARALFERYSLPLT